MVEPSQDPISRLNSALKGRYRIEREIGEGGMATVYLAEDLRHERKVALKVLKPELAAMVGAERFLAEIKTTANLSHPHILPLHDSGEADGFLYFVMPYVEGETLRDRLDREKQLPVDGAVTIARKVASALQFAHEHGVVHRDIKPGNILLQGGEPVVADFGIALAAGVAGGNRLTETGLSVGTPFYMSPEQATGDQEVGPASDTYALGCVLFELLTGDPPYPGSTAQAVLGKIIQGKPVSVTEARRSVPTNVDAAIRKALEKLPADRFTGATDFAKALADPGFRHGEETTALAPGGGQVTPLAMALGGLALVLAGALAWSLTTGPGAGGTEPGGRFAIDLPDGLAFSGATTQPLAITPDGDVLVFTLNVQQLQGVQASNQLYARPLGSLDAVPIRGSEGIGSFFLSPDGERVGFNAADETFKTIPLAGGPPTTIAETPGSVGGFRGADWGDGGWVVFATVAYPGLVKVPDVGGAAERVTVPDSTSQEIHRDPHVLPGGETVLFRVQRPGEPDQIAAASVESGRYELLTPGASPHYLEEGLIVFRRDDALWAVAGFDPERLTLEGEPFPVFDQVSQGSRPFSLSTDGTLVYQPSGGGEALRELVLVDRSGNERPLGVEPGLYSYPRFSPDEQVLAVVLSQEVAAAAPADLWLLDLERGSRSRLTFEGTNRYFPTWAPEGDRLAFAGGVDDPNTIQVARADGGGGIAPLLERDGLQYPTSWSSDGSLVYHENSLATGGRDLWVMPADGDPEPFLVTPFQEHAAGFSPDGRWIAYVSNESGQDEIYVRPYPGPGPQFTVSTDGGREPVWSSDGSELFYRTGDELMVVPVEIGDVFRAGTPQPLFTDQYLRDDAGAFGTANYDVTPDGQSFVMLSTTLDGGAGPRVVLVQNFLEELRELMPE